MRILVIQLARLGDIYKTWPTIRALKRKHAGCTIDVLTRDKFSNACSGLKEINKVVGLESQSILEPLFVEQNVEESVTFVQRFCTSLIQNKYDKVINLSFSSLSSHITFLLEQGGSEVLGYSRFEDGTLKISDAGSKFFYAQVGSGKYNRHHLMDVFAELAGVSPLEEKDFEPAELISINKEFVVNSKYIVVHLGASEREKIYSVSDWAKTLFDVLLNSDIKIILIGSKEEQELSNEVTRFLDVDKIIDFTGITGVTDLFPIIEKAELLVGCDSVPMHIASLVKTRCLNLSFSSVNFWETGPYSKGSCVLYEDTALDLPIEDVSKSILSLINNEEVKTPHYIRMNNRYKFIDSSAEFESKEEKKSEVSWNLIQKIYNKRETPINLIGEDLKGVEKLKEVNLVASNQLAVMESHLFEGKHDLKISMGILDRVDQIIDSIIAICPVLNPLGYWYKAEKVGIGPGSIEEIIRQTKVIHDKLDILLLDVLNKEELHKVVSLKESKGLGRINGFLQLERE